MEKQVLTTAARCAKDWVDELDKNKKRPEAFHEMLKEMSRQVLDSEAETLVFTLTDLVDQTGKVESNSAHGKAFSKFEEKLERFSDALRQYAIDNDFDFIPAIRMDKSQRINVVHFSAADAAQEGIRAAREIPAGAIRYTFDEKHRLWGVFGFISGMRLRTWPMVLAITIILAFALGYLVVAVLLLLASISAPSLNTMLGFVASLFVGYIVVRLLRSYDRFMTTRVTVAHDVLASISAPQSVIVMKPNGNEDPTLEVITASATCPVCEGEIRLRKPHFKCSHEVIGACRNNPTEHCFTFDHVTRLGWPITEAARRHVRLERKR
ncbi:hypothetical protein [Pseudidiomarina terrestris]|uniref:hypothetical protein n=1 Tax=Pseudidiomarina terrestris TaxID=2820060 RepID=UPI00264D08B2|nr:hypothetical protein [Pseudidiomarina sp. 1ASP75-5]MDN7134555.1 hypothetical protein [Pseudidiomarina sp. 1ASP75-5]